MIIDVDRDYGLDIETIKLKRIAMEMYVDKFHDPDKDIDDRAFGIFFYAFLRGREYALNGEDKK
jgi:hypothetical protein